MILSDQQPYLFPYAGIVEKQRMSDVHLVLADIAYRPDDKLARFVTPTGETFQPKMLVDKNDPRIAKVTLGGTAKLKRSIEQNLMSGKCQYRDRFAVVRGAIYEGMPYMDLWRAVTDVTFYALGINPKVVVAEEPVAGLDTFSRNIARVEREIGADRVSTYLCGPYVRTYYNPKVPFDITKMVVVQAKNPAPVSVAWNVARDEQVSLGDYDVTQAFGANA